jgi:hypothetical protein
MLAGPKKAIKQNENRNEKMTDTMEINETLITLTRQQQLSFCF